jgi:hypothetical protein
MPALGRRNPVDWQASEICCGDVGAYAQTGLPYWMARQCAWDLGNFIFNKFLISCGLVANAFFIR